jgi:hypothetical protein
MGKRTCVLSLQGATPPLRGIAGLEEVPTLLELVRGEGIAVEVVGTPASRKLPRTRLT